MRPALRIAACFTAILIAAGCGSDLHPVAEFTAPPGSIAPEINVGADGRAYLSWLQEQQGEFQLRYATADGHGWSEPRTAASGSDWMAGESDWPALTGTGGGGLAAVWHRRLGDKGYASELRMAFSPDGGANWNAAFALNDDGTTTEHGFVSLLPLPEALHVIWLDGRHTAGGHGGMAGGEHEDMGSGGATSLRHAVFDAAGTRVAESEVDARTCDCCHTAIAPVDGGFVIVYRDRTDTDIRDIVARRYIDGRWRDPVPVHEDGWRIDACPVNGPSIASAGNRVAVAWFSGSQDQPRVFAALSENAGESFGAPTRIDGGRALGRVDIALLPDGDAAVIWAELEEDAAVIRLRRVSPAGSPGPARTLPAESPSGFPRMVSATGGIVLAWTQNDAGASRVRGMVLNPDEI